MYFYAKQEAYAEIEEQFACKHAERELRERVIADGRLSYVTQCVNCGHTSQPVKRKEAMKLSDGKALPAYEEMLPIRWRAKKSAAYNRFWKTCRPNVEAEYQLYLQSPDWRRRREQVLLRAKSSCELCGEEPPAHVHHVTYARLGNEHLEDLLALCEVCHAHIHSPGAT